MTFEQSVDFLKALNLIDADIVADNNKSFYLSGNQASRTFRTRTERSDDLRLPAYWTFNININITDEDIDEDDVLFTISNITPVAPKISTSFASTEYLKELNGIIDAKELESFEVKNKLTDKIKALFKYIDYQEYNYLEMLEEKDEAEKEKEAKKAEYINGIKLTNVEPDVREAILKFIDKFTMKTFKDDYDLDLRFYSNGIDEIKQEELNFEEIDFITSSDLDIAGNEVKKYIVIGSIYDKVEIQGNYTVDYYNGDDWETEDVEVAIDNFELPLYVYKETESGKLIVDDFDYDFTSSEYWDKLRIPEWDDL